MSVKPVPAGHHTVTPYLVVSSAIEAINFYKRAFGAREITRMDGPQGKISHAELRIGDSMLMLSDEMPGSVTESPQSLGGTSVGVFLYVEDADKTFKQATAAGAKVETPLADMFWGDRYGKLTDPFGHSWSVATHKEDVSPEEMEKRMHKEMAGRPESARGGGAA
jgi:PhnB protein